MDTQHQDTTTAVDEQAPIDKGLLYALAYVLDGTSRQGLAAMKAEMHRELAAEYESRGTKSQAIRIDGEEVATLSLSFDNGGLTVTDPDAFVAWVEQNLPDEVEYKPVVRAATQKALLEKGGLVHDEASGEVIHAATGEVAAGVTYRPAGRTPKGFSFVPKKVNAKGVGVDGRARIEDALRDLNVAGLMGQVQQAALTTGADQ